MTITKKAKGEENSDEDGGNERGNGGAKGNGNGSLIECTEKKLHLFFFFEHIKSKFNLRELFIFFFFSFFSSYSPLFSQKKKFLYARKKRKKK